MPPHMLPACARQVARTRGRAQRCGEGRSLKRGRFVLGLDLIGEGQRRGGGLHHIIHLHHRGGRVRVWAAPSQLVAVVCVLMALSLFTVIVSFLFSEHEIPPQARAMRLA